MTDARFGIVQKTISFLFVVVLTLAGWMPAANAQTPEKQWSFTARDLASLTDKQTSKAERQRLLNSFVRFTPKTLSDIDLLYQAISFDLNTVRMKLQTIKAPRLMAQSRKYLVGDEVNTVKTAVIAAVGQGDREAIPALRQIMSNPKLARLNLYTMNALAQLRDPKLLEKLTDPKQTPEDSTMSGMYHEMLNHYGEEGFRRLTSRQPEGKASEFYVRYIRSLREPKLVPELTKLYYQTKDDRMKESILWAFLGIKTRECQPVLRHALADPAVEKISKELRMVIIWGVWRYNLKENARLKELTQQALESGNRTEKRIARKIGRDLGAGVLD